MTEKQVSYVEGLVVLGLIGAITGGCIAGIIILDAPPDILTTLATTGFGALLMKSKDVLSK